MKIDFDDLEYSQLDCIVLRPHCGSSVHSTILEAVQVSAKLGADVEFTFNEIAYKVEHRKLLDAYSARLTGDREA